MYLVLILGEAVKGLNKGAGVINDLIQRLSCRVSLAQDGAARYKCPMENDIIIIGGGPAGLCFARGLADTGLHVVLAEKQGEDGLADPAYDGREIALTHFSQRTMKTLGIWDLVGDENISVIRDAQVLNGKSPYALHFDHRESGEDNLGFMISNHNIRRASFQAAKSCKNLQMITGTGVEHIETNEQGARVTLEDGQTLHAPLIVAADSRFSKARKLMGIDAEILDFQRTCIVCRMDAQGGHDDTAYECFHYDRTLAILPLNKNQVSVVITINSDDADSILNMDKSAFGHDITERADKRFGTMTLASALYSYPLAAVYARRFYAKRLALLGDAAVGMHPVTAHGFNLGLKGGHTLVGEIKNALQTGSDLGAAAHLKRYHTKHRADSRPLYLGTNALVKLYTQDNLPARIARRTLLRLGNHIGPAKKLIMDQLTESDVA